MPSGVIILHGGQLRQVADLAPLDAALVANPQPAWITLSNSGGEKAFRVRPSEVALIEESE